MSQQQSRIPIPKILESHEIRLRKIEKNMRDSSGNMNNTRELSVQPHQEPTQDLEVRKEVEGMKRDMHEIVRRIQQQQQQQQQHQQQSITPNDLNQLVQKLSNHEQRMNSLETSIHALENKFNKLNDFALATNTDLLRFREQIFENATIKLHIQESVQETIEEQSQTHSETVENQDNDQEQSDEQPETVEEEQQTQQQHSQPVQEPQPTKRKEIDIQL